MKVRFLRTEDIDRSVAELLRNFCSRRNRVLSAPVPVEDILEKHLQVAGFGHRDHRNRCMTITWFGHGDRSEATLVSPT